MATIRPFKGVRPQKEYADKVASFPYDVVNSKEAGELAKNNPYSFLHVVKPEIDLPEGTNLYDDAVYAKGKENLYRLLEDGILFREKEPRLYIYRQRMGDHIQTGLVAGASVEDYENDVIKKHEHTREVKEKDRIRHVDTLNANTGPVFLTYRHRAEIDNLLEEYVKSNTPEYDFAADDGIQHTFWVIEDKELTEKLVKLFAGLDFLYVADGHHRSASAAKVGAMRKAANPNHTGEEPYNFFLSVLFPDNQLKILDYNRVVKDLNGLDEREFIDRVKEKFEVVPSDAPVAPAEKGEFGMYLAGKWYRLKARPGSWDNSDPVKRLDVAIIYDNLLKPVLNIGDPRTDERIDFIGGIRGLQELERRVDSGEMAVAFSMYPTSISELMDIADSGNVMPPKSTWFEPKLRSGLIINILDN
jgi:uncharacterized protein (DUF1015 family)